MRPLSTFASTSNAARITSRRVSVALSTAAPGADGVLRLTPQ